MIDKALIINMTVELLSWTQYFFFIERNFYQQKISNSQFNYLPEINFGKQRKSLTIPRLITYITSKIY